MMKSWFHGTTLAVCSLAGFLAVGGAARGEFAVFKINPGVSGMQLVPAQFTGPLVSSGTKFADTIGIVAQNGVSQTLSTALAGALMGDVTGGTFTLSPQSLILGAENPLPEFLPSSAETGSNSVVDAFGGDAVSNFGAMNTEARVAVRDMALRPVAGSVTVGSPANSMAVRIASSFIDVKTTADPPVASFYPLPLIVQEAVPNSSGSAVTGSLSGTITMPISLTYIFDSVVGGQVIDDGGRVMLVGTITATRIIPGDFNGDLKVDGADLTKWAGDWGAGSGSDVDGDFDTDGRDFLFWQQAFGFGVPVPAAGVVPEPAAAWLASMTALAGVAARMRRRP